MTKPTPRKTLRLPKKPPAPPSPPQSAAVKKMTQLGQPRGKK